MNKKEDNVRKKNNKFELEQLSNVKNIMNNMKQNKMKLKMIIDQHFTNSNNNNIQEQNNNNNF